MENQIPQYVVKFFWDIDPKDFDLQNDYFYIIARILEFGDQQSIRWVFKNYPIQKVREVIESNSKLLSKKTINFWNNVLS